MNEIIFSYTRTQAIEDGFLVKFPDYLRQSLADGPRDPQQVMDAIGHSQLTFRLGELVITSNAADTLPVNDVLGAFLRHLRCDWGNLDAEDWEANTRALKEQTRLFSVYVTQDGVRFYIITEWNREATTVLLPEDY